MLIPPINSMIDSLNFTMSTKNTETFKNKISLTFIGSLKIIEKLVGGVVRIKTNGRYL